MSLAAILTVVLVVLATAIGIGTTKVLKMKNDNAIEQVAEEVIKDKTGIDVDLSP